MRKILICLFLTTLSISFLSAQDQQDDLSIEMDQLFEQMEKAMKDMQGWYGDSKILMDTFMLKGIQPLAESPFEMQEIHPDSLNMNNIFDLLQEQMQQFSTQDWSQLEQMMREFSQQLPRPEGIPSKKKKKGTITL